MPEGLSVWGGGQRKHTSYDDGSFEPWVVRGIVSTEAPRYVEAFYTDAAKTFTKAKSLDKKIKGFIEQAEDDPEITPETMEEMNESCESLTTSVKAIKALISTMHGICEKKTK